MAKDDEIDEIEEIAKNLPKGAAISWGLVKPPQRGPKREMSISQIVGKAVEIADQDGLSAVSMSRVAAELGYTAMSLYRYIPSKEDLLLLMQEAVSDIPIPPEEDEKDWRESMRDYTSACIKIFTDHPWFAEIPITGTPIGPNNLKFVDWMLRPMKNFPFNEHEKMAIVLLISSYARSMGILYRDMNRAFQAGSTPEQFSGVNYSAALKKLVRADQYPYLHPIVMSGVYAGEHEDEDAALNDLDFGLERILDGIEYYLHAKLQEESQDNQGK